MSHCLRWVVALKPEATPLIERFGLRHCREAPDLFPVYRSRDGEMELVVSGPGKVASAAATSFLAAKGDAAAVSAWINFGIAGSGADDYGAAYLAGKVTDRASGQSWFPPSVVPRKSALPRIGIETVERPTDTYPDDGTLVEMEASGFYSVALRTTTAELCQVVKVVSDDRTHPMASISKGQVRDICTAALDRIDIWLEAFREIVREESARTAEPVGFAEWTGRLRYSETQRHRLRRLLRQWNSLNGTAGIAPRFTETETQNAQKMLDAFEVKIRGVSVPEI